MKGEVVQIHRTRDFAIVSAVKEQRAFWSELHLESQGPPLLYQFKGTAA